MHTDLLINGDFVTAEGAEEPGEEVMGFEQRVRCVI